MRGVEILDTTVTGDNQNLLINGSSGRWWRPSWTAGTPNRPQREWWHRMYAERDLAILEERA